MKYAAGKRAHTVCDICGITFRYKRKKKMWTGSFVCPECWNKKEESLDPKKYVPKHGDAEALRDSRSGEFDEVGPTDAQDYLDSIKGRC